MLIPARLTVHHGSFARTTLGRFRSLAFSARASIDLMIKSALVLILVTGCWQQNETNTKDEVSAVKKKEKSMPKKVGETVATQKESDAAQDLDVFSSISERPDRYLVGRIRIVDRKTILILSRFGEKAEKLERAVKEMNEDQELSMDAEAMVTGESGDRVLSHSSALVPKGHKDFVWAVKSTLRSNYGFATKDVLPTKPPQK
jgi:hypothetical protein